MSGSPTTTGCWKGFSRFLCSCGGHRVPQVSPADAFPTITPGSKVIPPPCRLQLEDKDGKHETNGHINHFYVPDDNGQVSYETDRVDGPSGESSAGEAEETKDLAQQVLDFHLKHSIYLELGKDKKLRVVHLKEVNAEEPQPYQSPTSVSSVSSSMEQPEKPPGAHGGGGGEEEDEYWFSKWTRKPRFRSIFERNTIHSGSGENDAIAGNSKDNNNTMENGGQLSKDFELARQAAAAKRRAWAYNNGNCDPVVEQSTEIEEEDEEFNSICMLDSNRQKWSKDKTISIEDNKDQQPQNSSDKDEQSPNNRSPVKVSSVKVEVENHPLNGSSNGFTNMGFESEQDEEIDGKQLKEEESSDHELKVDSSFVPASVDTQEGSPSKSNNGNAEMHDTPGRDSSIVVVPEVSPANNLANVQMTEVDLSTPKQPALFFIHGISGSSDVWKCQLDFFHSLGYEIVAPDLLGHGYSSAPYNAKLYYFESLAQDLLTVFDHFFQEGRRVVIIGHGYGACLASVIVRVRPKSACLLISISGGGPTPLVSRACCRGSLIPFYCTLFHKNPRKGRFDNPDLKHILPSAIHHYMLNGQVWSDGDSAFYRRITVPTLLVYGMKDKVVNLVEECEMERTIPKSFLEIIDSAGHMIMFEEPHRLNKMLGKFIQSWS